VKRDNQLGRVDSLHDSRMSDYQRLGLQGDKACCMDVEEPTLVVRLCSVVVMRMAHVVMIMTVGLNGGVVICMRIDRQHVESSCGAIVQVMRVAGLCGCSARPDDRHG
jgi:hypothetical protein